MQFEQQISSSGKPYYIDTITGKTQWGYENFFDTKIPLPEGYICLILNGKDVYKYIGYHEGLNSYSYSPHDLDKKSISATYKELKSLKTQTAINELFRRSDLFENVAFHLKCTPESIIDESLVFLASKANVLPQTIIDYIKQTELEELKLEENASLTAFSMISQTDPYFSSERSIRELCGLNMQEEELSRALEQLKDLNCIIKLQLIHEPVMTGCANGHTCDKESMKELLKTSIRRCPSCNDPIPNTVTTLMPNAFAKKIIEEFVEKYVNQRGEIWNEIKQICKEYKDAKKIREEKIDFLNKEKPLFERIRESERLRLERESERTREERESERLSEEIEAERLRLSRQSESARLAIEAGLERDPEVDRLARQEYEREHIEREAERRRLREAERVRLLEERQAERVRLHLERETEERRRVEEERVRVEAETARLERAIGGNFIYREPRSSRKQR